jgi:hypothetical protein
MRRLLRVIINYEYRVCEVVARSLMLKCMEEPFKEMRALVCADANADMMRAIVGDHVRM